jgi:putative FmdB family regulatory protein
MPTYEYKCPTGHLFEKTFSRITSQRHTKCPICGKRAERQISGGAGVHFKGSGFYATDYRRAAGTTEKSDNKAEKSEKAEKSDKTEKTDAPKTDKPADHKPKPK